MKELFTFIFFVSVASVSHAQWSKPDNNTSFTGTLLSQNLRVTSKKILSHQQQHSFSFVRDDHSEVRDIFSRDQSYQGIKYSYQSATSSQNSLYFNGEFSANESHLSSIYTMGRLMYGFSAGKGQNFIKTNQLFSGLSPYFVHGGSHTGFRYHGINLGYRLIGNSALYFGGATVKADQLENRHAIYSGAQIDNYSATLMSFMRGGDVIGRGAHIEAGLGRYQLAYRQISRDTRAHAKTLSFSMPGNKSGANKISFSFESINNPLYREQDDKRLMISFSGSWGKTYSRSSLDEEDGQPEQEKSQVKMAAIGLGVVGGALVLSSGSDSKDNQEIIVVLSQHDAGREVLNRINPLSVRENREYGGYVHRNPDGSYGYTEPKAGELASVNLSDVQVPNGTQKSASYHTHGGPDPRFDNENFSPQDIVSDRIEGIDGYLGTPAGRFKYHDVRAGQIQTLGTIAN